MPIRTRIRKFLANRRHARRHKTERKVSLIAAVALGEGANSELITGRTRDLSNTGLSLSLPITDEHQRTLIAVGETIRILLSLPAKTVRLRGNVVHSQALGESSQIIGVRIMEMYADDKAAYAEYLYSLG
jgi:hypothetical protein